LKTCLQHSLLYYSYLVHVGLICKQNYDAVKISGFREKIADVTQKQTQFTLFISIICNVARSESNYFRIGSSRKKFLS